MGDASVPPLRRAPTGAGATVARVGPVDSDPQPTDRPVDLTSDDPLAALHRWVADGQVDEAARARSRRRWLEKAAIEEATLGGVLLDLAERRRRSSFAPSQAAASLGRSSPSEPTSSAFVTLVSATRSCRQPASRLCNRHRATIYPLATGATTSSWPSVMR